MVGADDSHEISCLICYFLKKQKNLKLSSAAKCRWRFKGKKFRVRPKKLGTVG